MSEAIDAVLLVGIVDWYPPNYDSGAYEIFRLLSADSKSAYFSASTDGST